MQETLGGTGSDDLWSAGRLGLVGVLVLAAGAAGCFVALERILAVGQGQAAAALAMALSLCGAGIGAALTAVFRSAVVFGVGSAFPFLACAGGGAFLFASLTLPHMVQLESMAAPWSSGFILTVAILGVLCGLPFMAFFSALTGVVCRTAPRVGLTLGAAWLGAGAGFAVVVAIAPIFSLPMLTKVVALLPFAGAALFMLRKPSQMDRFVALVVFLLGAGLFAFLPVESFDPGVTRGSDLSRVLNYRNASRVLTTPGSMARADVVLPPQSRPLKFAPGLADPDMISLPRQLGVYQDGRLAAALPSVLRRSNLAYLDALPLSLPFELLSPERMLVAGGDWASLALSGVLRGTRQVVILWPDTTVPAALGRDLQDNYGHVFRGVRISRANPTTVLRSGRRYDLIAIGPQLPGGFSLHPAGEDSLRTAQTITAAFRALTPGGMLVISERLRPAPGRPLKLFTTLCQALSDARVNPASRVAFLRSPDRVVMLASRAPFSAGHVGRIRAFAKARDIDLVYFPTIRPDEANRHTQLAQPIYYGAALRLVEPTRDRYIRAFPADIRPATSDRPFAHDPDGLGLSGLGGGVAGRALAALVVLVLLGLPPILLPMLIMGGAIRAQPGKLRAGAFAACLGAGSGLVGLAVIHAASVLQGAPLTGGLTGLAALAVGAGLGCGLARLIAGGGSDPGRTRLSLVAGLVISSPAAVLITFGSGLVASMPAMDSLAAGVFVAPTGLGAGMALSSGLRLVSSRGPSYLAWVCGLICCAAAAGLLLAGPAALAAGYGATVIIGLFLYIPALIMLGIPWGGTFSS
jgi:hypothetical protein